MHYNRRRRLPRFGEKKDATQERTPRRLFDCARSTTKKIELSSLSLSLATLGVSSNPFNPLPLICASLVWPLWLQDTATLVVL